MRKRVVSAFSSSVLAMSLLVLCGLASFAEGKSSSHLRHAVAFEVSAPVRELAKLPMRPRYVLHAENRLHPSKKRPSGRVVDTVEQSSSGGGSNFLVEINVSGLGLGFPGFNTTSNYPDANIAVGDTQVVEWANNAYAVFDKSGHALTSAVSFSSFWRTGPCSKYGPEGHPIAQWDRIAHQWLLAENVVTGAPNAYAGYACIAVSTSADATGSYYLYQFSLGNGYPDLAKWAVWSNSFYQSNDNFGSDAKSFVGPYECAYERQKMLVGDPSAQQLCIQLSSDDFALMPADIDSPVPPPIGEDEFLFSLWDNSHLALYSFHMDWSTMPPSGSMTGNGGSQLFPVSAFTPACNGEYLGACVPQLGGPNLLVLGDRLLYRVAYYNYNGPNFQHWLVLHDVTASGGNEAERWYEFLATNQTIPVTSIQLLQSGTYAPDTANSRWMGSIARDTNGDIMIGYSESNPDIYPTISIAGRLSTDSPGKMEGELPVYSSRGYYSGVFDYNIYRWGDYTSLRLDPADNCTLWYANEYYTATGTSNWSTRINSACFDGCGACGSRK